MVRGEAIKEKFERLKCLPDMEGLENIGEIKKPKGELCSLLDQENLRWKQRGKRHWLKDEDRNTKFFHTCAN